MTERKKNWLTIIFSTLTPSIIVGIVYAIFYFGSQSEASANQQKENERFRADINELRVTKADNAALMRIYNENKDAHKRLEDGQELILKELLKRN